MGYAPGLTAYESYSRRIHSPQIQPNITLKSISSLFVATEMSSLLGTQNVGNRGQLPLQRKSVRSRCPFGLESSRRGPICPVFMHRQLLTLCLTFTACSETTSDTKLVSFCTNETSESIDRKSLRSIPVATALFSFRVWLRFVHDSLPSISRRSAAEEKQRTEVSWCRHRWKTRLHGNPGVTSPNRVQMLLTTEAFFKRTASISYVYIAKRFLCFVFFFLVCFWCYITPFRALGIISNVWGEFCMETAFSPVPLPQHMDIYFLRK